MHRTSELDLLTVASLMPTPDGILLLAANAGLTADGQDGALFRDRADDSDLDMTDLAMLISFASLLLGLLALLPANL